MNVCGAGAPIVPDKLVTRQHLWQPYPFGEASLFQCSHCRVLADTAASITALPEECPDVAPRLPHLLRMRPTPYGKPRGVCMCCILPDRDSFAWECGNRKDVPPMKNRT